MRQPLQNIVDWLKAASPAVATLVRRVNLGLKTLRRVRGSVRWLAGRSGKTVAAVPTSERRLLMVYDLSSQPFSIGDVLVFQEAALVLLQESGCGKVDFALVYAPTAPAVGDPVFAGITGDNCLYHLAAILPVAQVNPYLGSLFLFDDHRQLERFIIDNHDRYQVWPSAGDYLRQEYLYYDIFNSLLAPYHAAHGALPSLGSRANLRTWAQDFFRDWVLPAVPVTVQLRRNAKNPARNSDYEVWLRFFAACHGRYPVKFIILCAESELDGRFAELPNVLLAKRHRTNVEQELALIELAAMHMGASSGPGTMALFSAKPYLLLNTPSQPLLKTGFVQSGDFIRAPFARPGQKFTTCPETLDLLLAEFQEMWLQVDLAQWEKQTNQALRPATDDYAWLR